MRDVAAKPKAVQDGARIANAIVDVDEGPTRREIERGLDYVHERLGANTARTLESAAFTYALIELLIERGLLSIDEVDARKKAVAVRLLKRFEAKDGGVAVQHTGHDKYHPPSVVEICCANRISLCQAACCKMVFPLSRQDVEEGIIHWEFGRPYVIAKREDGYCRHLGEHRRCAVHDARPLPCRVYDCRNDPRVWIDFERRIINPKITDPDWPHNLSPEERHPWGQP